MTWITIHPLPPLIFLLLPKKMKSKPQTTCPAAKAARPFVSTSRTAGSEGSDANDEGEDTQSFKPGRLPVNAIQKVQALGKHTTEEALSIANEYGKSLGTIMAAAGLSTKATRTEYGTCTRHGMLMPILRQNEVYFFLSFTLC